MTRRLVRGRSLAFVASALTAGVLWPACSQSLARPPPMFPLPIVVMFMVVLTPIRAGYSFGG